MYVSRWELAPFSNRGRQGPAGRGGGRLNLSVDHWNIRKTDVVGDHADTAPPFANQRRPPVGQRPHWHGPRWRCVCASTNESFR